MFDSMESAYKDDGIFVVLRVSDFLFWKAQRRRTEGGNKTFIQLRPHLADTVFNYNPSPRSSFFQVETNVDLYLTVENLSNFLYSIVYVTCVHLRDTAKKEGFCSGHTWDKPPAKYLVWWEDRERVTVTVMVDVSPSYGVHVDGSQWEMGLSVCQIIKYWYDSVKCSISDRECIEICKSLGNFAHSPNQKFVWT